MFRILILTLILGQQLITHLDRISFPHLLHHRWAFAHLGLFVQWMIMQRSYTAPLPTYLPTALGIRKTTVSMAFKSCGASEAIFAMMVLSALADPNRRVSCFGVPLTNLQALVPTIGYETFGLFSFWGAQPRSVILIGHGAHLGGAVFGRYITVLDHVYGRGLEDQKLETIFLGRRQGHGSRARCYLTCSAS